MLPAPIYHSLPAIYAALGVACLVVLQSPFNVLPAVMFIALAVTVYYKRQQYRIERAGRRSRTTRATATHVQGEEAKLVSAARDLGRKLPKQPGRSVVDRRRHAGPVTFPLVDSWNRVIHKDRRRPGNRLKD